MMLPAEMGKQPSMKKTKRDRQSISLFILLFMLITCSPLWSRQVAVLESDEVSVYYDEPLSSAAREVAHIYPAVRAELEATLMWKVDFRPTVLLVSDRETFSRMAGSSLFVAYALPEKMLIVIDYSRMNTEPFTLAPTLKHELCHLLLHRSIQKSHLPRWLDEGVCQWASGGFAEFITGRRQSALSWAAVSGRFIMLDALERNFPEDEQSLALAYEESRSLVEYIVATFGRNGILNILEAMKNGQGVNNAIGMSLGISLEELERRWQESQRNWTAIISYLVVNLYTILFVCAALLTIAIYIRVLIRKKRFKDEEDDSPVP
jgi:Peptidase MA superfamily